VISMDKVGDVMWGVSADRKIRIWNSTVWWCAGYPAL